MDKKQIIEDAPSDATHYAINIETGEIKYVIAYGDNYLVLPLSEFKIVLAFKRWNVHKLP